MKVAARNNTNVCVSHDESDKHLIKKNLSSARYNVEHTEDSSLFISMFFIKHLLITATHQIPT